MVLKDQKMTGLAAELRKKRHWTKNVTPEPASARGTRPYTSSTLKAKYGSQQMMNTATAAGC